MIDNNEFVEGLEFFFFFQAEDGIRYLTVTGVQTCALPISRRRLPALQRRSREPPARIGQSCATPLDYLWRIQIHRSPRRLHSAELRCLPEHSSLSQRRERADRKSTRLNSSHSQISYAVFCL